MSMFENNPVHRCGQPRTARFRGSPRDIRHAGAHGRALAALALVLLAGCRNASRDAAVPEAPTFSADVAPILHAHCGGCHRPDGAAPFPLLRYEEAREQAALIAAAVRVGRMPPWLPEPSDYPFADERRLTEREVAILERWAAQGAPPGDLASAPAPPRSAGGWSLGEPDLIIEMPEPFPIRADEGEVFRNFVLPVPIDSPRYVRAVDMLPGDARVVHHATMAVDPTSLSRQEDARDEEPGFDGMFTRGGGRPPGGFFVGWTPGRVSRPNPQGLAWMLEPETDIVLQMHLRPHAHTASVRARLGFYFSDEPPARTPTLLRLGGQTLDIPPGVADYVVTDSFTIPVDIDALGLYPHAHYLARVMDVRAVLPDGSVRQVLRIDDWDFNWQDAYTFREPVALPAGTTLRLRYVYDNSAANPRNPSRPPRRVVYGPGSADEMAELWIQALPRAENDLATLQREVNRKGLRDRIEGWTHLIALHPDDGAAHANLAAYLAMAGEPDRAILHYRRAIEIEPDYASAHYNLAILLETRGDTASALIHYRESIRARPDHAGGHNNLGSLLVSMGKEDEAAGHFRQAIALEPGRAEARNNLGRLLWDRGRADEAVAQYRAALEAEPDAAAPRFNLAFALATLGRTTEALEQFGHGARLQPSAVEAHLAMAWILATHANASARRPGEAVALAERAARMFGRPHPRILDVQAAAQAAAGRFDVAAALAREAIRIAAAAGAEEMVATIRARLQVYLNHRPFVEPPRAAGTSRTPGDHR